MVATFNVNPVITIIYDCLTNADDETGLIIFYKELFFFLSSILKHNVLIIGGNMDAQIGKNEDNEFGLHNTSNRNVEHLIDFSLENEQTSLNANFQKRKRKLCTYTYANNDKAQIDHIPINKK